MMIKPIPANGPDGSIWFKAYVLAQKGADCDLN